MTYLCWLLMWFEALSGLKINLEKSELFPIGRIDNAELLVANLGCKVGSLPTTNLGLPWGAHYNSSVVWDGVEECFCKRLAMWKKQNISKGGRVTLINSMLASLPLYLMSILHLPRKVKLKLEQIQRNFLRGGGPLEHKMHLVNWETVCLDKRKGGLGIKNLANLNKALLCKWSWRFAIEKDVLWNEVIRVKYGEVEGGWATYVVRATHGMGF